MRCLKLDLGAVFTEKSRPMPRTRLGSSSWQLEDEPLAKLRDKVVIGRKTLDEVYGAPLYGIKTGLNEAFIIDTPTCDQLVAQDEKSVELLKPFLKGEEIKRWRVELLEGLFLINTPKGKVNIDEYPSVRDWLLPFKADLEKRATKQDWWELQQAQLAYQSKFEGSKIVYLDIANGSPFALDPNGALIDCTVFAIAGADEWLLPYLNSRVVWLQLIGETPIARGGYIRLKQQYISRIVLPVGSKSELEIASQCRS